MLEFGSLALIAAIFGALIWASWRWDDFLDSP
jgi:hypothetical protein